METSDDLNCLDARRELTAGPRWIGTRLQRHLDRCPGCAAYRDELRVRDERLAVSLRVPVPDGLADRVLLRQGLGRARAPRWLALAAMLVVALGVSGFFGVQHWRQAPALEAIAHVLEDEPRELIIWRRADPQRLAAAAQRAGVTLEGGAMAVRYLGTCPFRGGYAHHVLLGTPFGKATLLLTPDAPLRSTVVAEGRGLAALAAPTRAGNVFLVADSAETLKRIAALVRR